MRRIALLALMTLLAGCKAERPAAAVRVELANGANAGVYTAIAPAPGCVRGLLGPGSWALQLTDWTGPKAGMRSLQLVVPSQSRPKELYLGLVFGDFFTGSVHEIETRPDAPLLKGRGELGMDSTEDGATLVVTGSTGDTVALTATIACARTQEKPGATP
jgi:hypothetical protein